MPMTTSLDKNIQYLKGIGEKRALLFNKLGIFTVGDLLSFYPRAYENWNDLTLFKDAPEGEDICVRATVISPVSAYSTGMNTVYTTALYDGDTILSVNFYNNKYVSSQLKEGNDYLFFGRIAVNKRGDRELRSPKFAREEKSDKYHPVYRQTEKLSSGIIGSAVKTALALYANEIPEPLPASQLTHYRLPGAAEAIRAIHFPETEEELAAARRRLIYEELLILQLGILSAGKNKTEHTDFSVQEDYSREFAALLPFRMTNAQERAVRECVADLGRDVPMRRLLQGDVGSGKTAVAASLIYTVVKNGGQCALMAPTEVLAAQHEATFGKLFANTGIRVCLLTGSMTAKNKRLVREKIAAGEADLVIGTHALITEDVQFRSLALAITDEQHRFGVTQRAALRGKGRSPHVLVMSATPIPRTLSLIIYGDLDISVLDEKPAGRQLIKTYKVTSAYHERLYAFIKKEIAAGHQCYIVCALVEESEETAKDRISAESYSKELSDTVFRDYRTDLLHGKMKPKTKDEVMERFKNGETDILICTVVIEVGIDVPNATVMVIENAECFGLSQLHQLRGRVGRGGSQSYCILVSDSKNEKTSERLEVLCSSNDGFRIADEDLKLRGPGDFFGSRQSGLPALKIADLMGDTKILYAARNEAEKLLQADPSLSRPENKPLRERVSALFADIS